MKYLLILAGLWLVSCQNAPNDPHAHNPDGSHIGEAAERPTVDYTIWTEKIELFVEFPALIVGKTSSFAAHFTVLNEHKAVTKGVVTVSLIKGDKGIRHTVNAPASAGIFKPALQLKEPGNYQLEFDIETPDFVDRILINDITVFAAESDAIAANIEEKKAGNITFLKEQAWKIDFETTMISREVIYSTIPSSGVWQTTSSNRRTIVATGSGAVNFAMSNLTVGSKVTKGQTLLNIKSKGFAENNQNTELIKAKATFTRAKANYDRKKELFESNAMAKTDLEEAEMEYNVAKANYELLSEGYAAGGKQILAPFDGYIETISVENGQFVDQGIELLEISTAISNVLEANISSTYAPQMDDLKDLWYKNEADVWLSLIKTGGEILSVAKSVNDKQALLSVFAKTKNPVSMLIGSFCEVQLAFGSGTETIVMPASALLEDYGNYSAIVQVTGESFERRPINIGARNGNKVEVLSGLAAGEVVVSKGAYQVKMASMSGEVPAHGHSH